ncbi:hypothetical protein DMA11_22870 [Marinilabiliaceae bacterium JC017]|nr:hypothetical protein DMA11_22870 [Marinilabiliaceae bacterium JC017]
MTETMEKLNVNLFQQKSIQYGVKSVKTRTMNRSGILADLTSGLNERSITDDFDKQIEVIEFLSNKLKGLFSAAKHIMILNFTHMPQH